MSHIRDIAQLDYYDDGIHCGSYSLLEIILMVQIEKERSRMDSSRILHIHPQTTRI